MTDQDRISRYIEGSEDVSDLLKGHQLNIEECNQSLSDLDHILELEPNLSDEEKLTISNKRLSILESRRQSKDMERVINQILPKQTEGRTTIDRYEFAIRQLGDRFYTPRQLTVQDVLDREPSTDAISLVKGG